MKFFVDTADIDEIKDLAATGLLDGVTPNPSLVAKTGKDFISLIKEICEVVTDGPVSAEVAATDYATMRKEADVLRAIADNIAVKVPLTQDGLKACAAFVSLFVGRLDNICFQGLDLIADILTIYDNYPQYDTEVLVASIRNPMHIIESAKMGAHVITAPPKVIKQLYNHPLTDKGLAAFVSDWEKTGQSIL